MRGDGADDVVEQALDAGGKDAGLAVLGVIALDDADAAERFGEAARDLSVDFGALAEDGTDGLEGLLQDEAEDDKDAEGEQRHAAADADEDAEGDDGGEDSADEFEQAGTDEVADAFDVGHDARDQGAGAVFVVEGDGQAADVVLNLGAELRDETLAGSGEQLGERVGGDALNKGGSGDGADNVWQQMDLMLIHHVVDEVTRRDGQGEAADAVNDDQKKTAEEKPATWPDELPDLGHDLLQFWLGTLRSEIGRCGFAHVARGAVCGLHTAAEIG